MADPSASFFSPTHERESGSRREREMRVKNLSLFSPGAEQAVGWLAGLLLLFVFLSASLVRLINSPQTP